MLCSELSQEEKAASRRRWSAARRSGTARLLGETELDPRRLLLIAAGIDTRESCFLIVNHDLCFWAWRPHAHAGALKGRAAVGQGLSGQEPGHKFMQGL